MASRMFRRTMRGDPVEVLHIIGGRRRAAENCFPVVAIFVSQFEFLHAVGVRFSWNICMRLKVVGWPRSTSSHAVCVPASVAQRVFSSSSSAMSALYRDPVGNVGGGDFPEAREGAHPRRFSRRRGRRVSTSRRCRCPRGPSGTEIWMPSSVCLISALPPVITAQETISC